MAMINHFSELLVWQKARVFCQTIFPLTTRGLFAKDFKHRDQINDSSGSVMDNIAEGFGRHGKNEFINFLTISMGSCTESQSQAFRAFDKNYISEEELKKIIEQGKEIERMTTSLIASLNRSSVSGLKFKGRK